MIKRLQNKKRAEKVNNELIDIGRGFYKTLGVIENELDLLRDLLKETNKLSMNYDYYKEKLYTFINIINSVSVEGKNGILLEKIKNIEELLNENFDIIGQHGTTIKKEIMKKLERLENRDIDNKEKKKILLEIIDELELNDISSNGGDITGKFLFSQEQIVKTGMISFCGVSERQIKSQERCIISALDGKMHDAIHYLYEYVDNYQYSLCEPFTTFELVSIKNMIIVILKII